MYEFIGLLTLHLGSYKYDVLMFCLQGSEVGTLLPEFQLWNIVYAAYCNHYS